MEFLDQFRHSWEEELTTEKPKSSNESSIGDLCYIGAKFKQSIEHESPIPAASESLHPSNSTTNMVSFTIGIRTFSSTASSSSSKASLIEPPVKKLKVSNPSLLDELIRDINESTDIPFFNVSLPREIALQIFDYLSLKDIYSCLQVCRSWHSLSHDELLWYNLYHRFRFDGQNKDDDNSWKNHFKESVLFNRKVKQNFKNHQCRTTKLTHRLGFVLTCASNNETNIVGGYSTGIIRTWSIQDILDNEGNDEDDEQSDTPNIIYESTNSNPYDDMYSVQSVGFLKDSVYALHDDGLLEVWLTATGKQPHYTHQLTSLPIKHVANDENILCTTSSAKFSVWNFNKHENKTVPQYQELNFLTDLNDRISSFCMSSYHTVPISIVAGNKSLYCISLSNLVHRYSFYSMLESSYAPKLPLDIHNNEPLGIVGIDREIKLFDLQSGRCNVVLTNYKNFPTNIHLIRADKCPPNEFIAAFDNYQVSIFDRRQKQGAIQHFYNHYSTITTLQMDTWKLASTDSCGFVRLWDRRMNPHSLWSMNPQSHPIRHCSFDKQTLICALTPICKRPHMIDYQIEPDILCGHIYVCNFKSDVSTQLDEDLKICTSSYDAPLASNRRIALHTPYDIIN